MDSRYSSSWSLWLAWDMTPWQVEQIVSMGSPTRSAIAKVRAFSVSPSLRFFSWRTPAPVQDAPCMVIRSSSMPSRRHISSVEA